MFIKSTSEKLDAILEFCVKDNNLISEKQIRENLFPELNKDEMKVLLRMIDNSGKDVLNINFKAFGVLIESNGLTKGFLDEGGFTTIENSELIQLEKQQEKENLEFEKSKIDFELAKETLKEFPKTKKRAKVAYIIAIILAFVQLIQWIITLLPKD